VQIPILKEEAGMEGTTLGDNTEIEDICIQNVFSARRGRQAAAQLPALWQDSERGSHADTGEPIARNTGAAASY
jgi:hypothetical protein